MTKDLVEQITEQDLLEIDKTLHNIWMNGDWSYKDGDYFDHVLKTLKENAVEN